MTLDEWKALATASPSQYTNWQLRKSWADLCEAYSADELSAHLKPLAQKLTKPPLPAMHGTPLDLTSGPEASAAARLNLSVPVLLQTFASGRCVTKDLKPMETYRRNVTYRLGPDIYRAVQQLNNPINGVMFWLDFFNGYLPKKREAGTVNPDFWGQLDKYMLLTSVIDAKQRAPLAWMRSKDDLRYDIGNVLSETPPWDWPWGNVTEQLAAVFSKGPEGLLEVANQIRDGRVSVMSPDSAEFDWTMLAFEDSRIRTTEGPIYRSIAANERVIDALLNGRMRSSRIQEGITVDLAAEHALAYDLIVEMAQEGHLFAYRQAYCAITADDAQAGTDDGQSLRLKLLEALKQADEPYDERAYKRLKDRVSVFSAWGAWISALWGSVPFTRETFTAEDIDTSSCIRRMSAES